MRWFLLVENVAEVEKSQIEQRFQRNVGEFQNVAVRWQWNKDEQRFYALTALCSEIFKALVRRQIAMFQENGLETKFVAFAQVVEEGRVGCVQ